MYGIYWCYDCIYVVFLGKDCYFSFGVEDFVDFFIVGFGVFYIGVLGRMFYGRVYDFIYFFF